MKPALAEMPRSGSGTLAIEQRVRDPKPVDVEEEWEADNHWSDACWLGSDGEDDDEDGRTATSGHSDDDDHVVEYDAGFRCLIDPKSLMFLYGLHLDYSDALVGGGFSFSNPNAESSCGCGKSFGV